MQKPDAIRVSEDDLPNFRPVATGIYRGGQPSERGFARLKQLGVRSIINLRDERHFIGHEERIVQQLGMRLFSIPLSPFVEPPQESIERCLELMADEQHHSIFVHCLHGMDRTGMIISILRLHAHEWTLEQAWAEMLELGFHAEFHNLTRAVHSYAGKRRSLDPL